MDAAVVDSSCVSLANPSKRQLELITLTPMPNVKAYIYLLSIYQLLLLLNNKFYKNIIKKNPSKQCAMLCFSITLFKQHLDSIFFFLICAVGLWVLRPLLAYCTSPG
jgi:hypothetical protein